MEEMKRKLFHRYSSHTNDSEGESQTGSGHKKNGADISRGFTCITAVLIVLLFVFSAHRVIGTSMYPTLDDGQFVISVRLFGTPEYGDIVIAHSAELSELLIKRVIGTPGDKVTIDTQGRILVNGNISVYGEGNALITAMEGMQQMDNGSYQAVLGEKEFFLVGDNHENSLDSRRLGPVKKEKILEKVILPSS